MVYTRSSCTNCRTTFVITYGEKEFFESKGYQLPKKCENCRGNKSSNSGYISPSLGSINATHKQQRRKGFCFITTAVCEYLHKPDDCYELTTLRIFRDKWLAIQPSGEAIIKEYYQIAPLIVAALDSSIEKDKVYEDLWNKYISPCIKLIELTAYSACMDLYMEMVNNLKNKFRKEKLI